MRKEDKLRLPPRLKLTLPPSYHVERSVLGYHLCIQEIQEAWGSRISLTRLVAAFTRDTAAGEIEDYAISHSRREVK